MTFETKIIGSFGIIPSWLDSFVQIQTGGYQKREEHMSIKQMGLCLGIS